VLEALVPADRLAPTASLDELLSGATGRQPLIDGAGKSGARLERLTIDGRRYVLKHLDVAVDWTMRAVGDFGGVTLALWRRGVLADLPSCIRQPIVGVAHDPAQGPGCRNTAVLMEDVAEWLVPVTDEPIASVQHAAFIDHMAAFHARFWEGGAEIDLVPAMHRYLELSPWMAAAEATLGSAHLVPRLVAEGWPRLEEVAPAAAGVVLPLAREPWPLVAALAATPQTLVHGNFKLDNLGTDPSGRTILLDWEGTGRGAALSDLAWYLAINCRRLPQSKEQTITAYREALERRGVDTEPWWDRQLALCLLGGLVQFGWEKALGGYDDELAWWEGHAVAGARLLP
jgi:Phosphotransferase enzyme family